jgi:hypothetical protein
MDALSRVAKFGYAVLLRTLTAMGGAVAAYGATGMFTSGGIMPPNAIVIAGLVMCGASLLALWASERTLTGVWPALLIAAVPYSLYAIGSWSATECPPGHPPITPTYSCAPVGSHALAVISPIVALIGVAALVLDLRMLARMVRVGPKGRAVLQTGSR